MRTTIKVAWLIISTLCIVYTAAAFTVTSRPCQRSSMRRFLSSQQEDPTNERKSEGLFDFLMNPYQSKIPKEIEAEIYAAEANTPAAKDRNQRIAFYSILAFTGILSAFFNVFLSELRSTPPMPLEGIVVTATDAVVGTVAPYTLDDAGFGWVEESNFLVRFLFLNKIGGALLLLSGAGAGLLAEAEFDTRRITAEKIYEELVRRRQEKTQQGGNSSSTASKKKKRRSGKEAKRIGALAEVIDSTDEEPISVPSSSQAAPVQETLPDNVTPSAPTTKEEAPPQEEKKKEGGILGTLKSFYERADSLAASQALLINKELEDRGVIEKITDETGLKVIGKEAAAKLRQESGGKTSDTKPKA